MRLAILSSGNGWHVRDLLRAAADLRIDAMPVDFRKLAASVAGGTGNPATALEDLAGYEGVLVRTMPPGSLEQVVLRMNVLHRLEARGVRVLNPPASLETCIDKYLSIARLEAAGLPVPATWVCQHGDAAMAAFARLDRDVVVKPLFGSEGRGMLRVTDEDLAWRTFRAIERTQGVIYLQRFIDHPGWDLRAFVLAGRVLASMRRHGRGGWRTNIAQGGRGEAVSLTSAEEDLALRAAAAVGVAAGGVDLLPDRAGTYHVLEVNAVPGWRALAPVTGIDVARSMLTWFG
ncbi:MAG: RimK family alpha-L-glutamate ligase [Gemmataceae bacterium]